MLSNLRLMFRLVPFPTRRRTRFYYPVEVDLYLLPSSVVEVEEVGYFHFKASDLVDSPAGTLDMICEK